MSKNIEEEFANALAAANKEADGKDSDILASPEHIALGKIASVIRKNFYSESNRKSNVRGQIEAIVEDMKLP